MRQKMIPLKKIIFIIIIGIILSSVTEVFSISSSVKSQKDYRYTLDALRKIKIMVKNFPSEEKNKLYDNIQDLFESASEEYYGQNFVSSHIKFTTVKSRLIILLELIASEYMQRSKSILDSTSKKSFNILMDYGKNSAYASYFKIPFDPLKDVKPYNDKFQAKDYHFFRDKETIERYLKRGYKRYHATKKIMGNSDFIFLKNKKNKKPKTINYIISSLMDVIYLCREAKQYGIEIHKLLKIELFGDIRTKYRIQKKNINPIFDERIPKDFRIDAIDNMMLLYSVEMQRLEKIKKQYSITE